MAFSDNPFLESWSIPESLPDKKCHVISSPNFYMRPIHLRLSNQSLTEPFAVFDTISEKRIVEADEFYAELQAQMADEDAKNVQRQALAGVLWTKQFYYYDVPE